jgi:SAM-dependent methyltransferase
MTWEDLDWPALDRLRAGFLDGAAAGGPYWKSASDLASYDFTYGERIGWKWDHVLRELKLRGWTPPVRSVFDWGCGSGIAARRVISFFGADQFDSLRVWDHSPVACDFATDAVARAFPALDVSSVTPGFLASNEPVGLLLISHVLNELPPEALASLRALIARAEAVIWVEPGTHGVSRSLGALRKEFLPDFRLVAPCTHQQACPVLAPGNERDWCHHFAPPPSEIFASSEWVKFGQRAGIDLRSLPYCFLALDRQRDAASPAGLSRIIGRPEHFKPYVRVLNCDATGLAELTLLKRTDPALYKQLDRNREPLVYRWRREGNSILGVET